MNLERLLSCNARAELAKRNFKDFVSYLKPGYIFKEFHDYIISRLEAFERGEIAKLMIFMPPQHGKSELASRLFPAYMLGKNPKRKIIVSSYSATIAHEFARDIKNNINGIEYREIFDTKIGASKLDDGSYSDSSHYYHTAPHKGFVYAVGRGGSITSKSMDIGIIDDPLKGREEAMSMQLKTKLWDWYINDWRTRMHNESQELLIQTRWDSDDLGGKLLSKEGDQWEVICFPAIKTKDYSEYDHREEGEVLFPEKHSLKRILDVKSKSEVTFNSLYQQDPKPDENILVHPNFIMVKEFPIQSIERWIVGIDYGYTNSPTAIVRVGIWGNKRYWQCLAYEPAISPENIYKALEVSGLHKTIIYSEHDPAMILKLRKLGLRVMPADKAIYAGIIEVNLCENYYLESDKWIRFEVTNYQYITIGEIKLNDPVDKDDHAMNAGRYAVYTDSLKHTKRK